jgi:hypothetical protein
MTPRAIRRKWVIGEDFAEHLRPGFDGFSPSQPPAKNSNAIAMQKMRIPLGNDLQ